MAEKWYIVEQFGKVGPFSLQDMLSSVERGDYDYSITVESATTQQRTTLTELIAKKKKARRAKKKRADADATRIVPSERRRNLEVIGSPSAEGNVSPEPNRRGKTTAEHASSLSHTNRRYRLPRDNSRSLLVIPAMLAGGVVSLALFYGVQKLTVAGEGGSETTANIVDLPLDPEEFTPIDTYETEKGGGRKPKALDIKTARRKSNQVVLLGPLSFSKSELYRCRVKCKIEFKDTRGSHITGVFFAQAFKNELLKRTRRVLVKGRISADGRELYLQSISP